MGKYKVGDCLIHKHTKQVVVITDKNPFGITKDKLVVKFDTNEFATKYEIDNNYNKLDLNCPVARVLFTSNSNKAVTNETNEE